MTISADPKIVVQQDEVGGAKLRANLNETDRIQARLAKSIQDSNFQAAYRKAAEASTELKAAQDRLASSTASTVPPAASATSATASMAGGFVVAVNQAMELGKKVADLAEDFINFARKGAKGADVAERFKAYGDAVPKLNELRDALQGAVSDTTARQFANQAVALGMTSAEILKAADAVTVLAMNAGRSAETQAFLDAAIKGQAGTFRELGVAIDTSSESFEGMSKVEKKNQFLRELSIASAKVEGDGIGRNTLAYTRMDVAVANLKSRLASYSNEALISSGVLDTITEGLGKAAKFANDNKDSFIALGKAALAIAEVVVNNLVVALTDTAGRLGKVMEIAGPVIDILAMASTKLTDLVTWAEKSALSFIGLGEAEKGITPAFERVNGLIKDVAAGNKDLTAEQKAAAEAATVLGQALDEEISEKSKLAAEETRKLNEKLKEFQAIIDAPADEKTINGWMRELRAGTDVQFLADSIAAQSTTLEQAREDIAELEDKMMSSKFGHRGPGQVTVWEEASLEDLARLDQVIELTEAKFNKVDKATKGGGSSKSAGPKSQWHDEWTDRIEAQTFGWKEMLRVERLNSDRLTVIQQMALWEGIDQLSAGLAVELSRVEYVAKYKRALVEEERKIAAKETADRAGFAASAQDSVFRILGTASESGWWKAALGFAEQTALGLGTVFTAPWESATHFLSAGEFLVMQAIASSMPGSKGGSSGAGSSRPMTAAAGNSMLARPDSRSSGAGDGKQVTQLWLRDRIVGETIIADMADVARRGGKRIPTEAIGGGNRRGF
jgi:hypothetical protein